MHLYEKRQEVEAVVAGYKNQHETIGLVPTMGALHKGHLTLIEQCLLENDRTIVSIFVNPTQFNNLKDLEKYPRDLEKDIALLNNLSQDIIVFAPNSNELYQNNIETKGYDFGDLADQMEGRFRPGHFDGVGTVLHIFFELLQPDNAYFGKKDFQQLAIIKKLVALENLPVQIIGCPIYREESGLAYSSRNERLSKLHREHASFIYETLIKVREKFGIDNAIQLRERVKKQFENNPYFKLEYFEICETKNLQPVSVFEKSKKYRAFIAVFADDIRLIDNIALN